MITPASSKPQPKSSAQQSPPLRPTPPQPSPTTIQIINNQAALNRKMDRILALLLPPPPVSSEMAASSAAPPNPLDQIVTILKDGATADLETRAQLDAVLAWILRPSATTEAHAQSLLAKSRKAT